VLANEMGRPKEALPYLSRGMIRIIREMIYVVLGYARLYASQRDLVSGTALLEWGIRTLQGLKASTRQIIRTRSARCFSPIWPAFRWIPETEAAPGILCAMP